MTECNDFKLSKTSNHCLIIQFFSHFQSCKSHANHRDNGSWSSISPTCKQKQASCFSLLTETILLAGFISCTCSLPKPLPLQTSSWYKTAFQCSRNKQLNGYAHEAQTLKSSKNLRPKAHARVEKSTTPQSRYSLEDMKQKQHCSCVAGWSWLTILNKG